MKTVLALLVIFSLVSIKKCQPARQLNNLEEGIKYFHTVINNNCKEIHLLFFHVSFT